ncbi:COP9 signalosome complex subunit 4 [Thecamonas trahens ATCC 50062]|uniref:COP9 signalosome complex subunit 4 n=1 Tax=Thecamonas trahens ATCC 50062 TaxID=461836 RepID=A0A0L0DC63_THETB|nr:COP9 signalosome complex subunit 4 [Thecamonas trahens ATCC 50062]KNC48898.1 COP9 signalosome complex subunit 4 [Thecamonas trahens ATCC 50062]|eukprot:XP_013758316.1 COP9 signalosome complex subunit 4 [Thecamonas trahens ATCC 50062]
MASTESRLLATGGDTEACAAILRDAVAASDATALHTFIDFMTSNDRPPVVRINLVTVFSNELGKVTDRQVHEAVASAAHGKLAGQESFVEQLGKIAKDMADRLQAAELWKETAVWLARVPMERMPAGDRFVLNVKIAQVYLQIPDSISAGAYLNRALKDQAACKDEQYSTLFNVCRAQVLDYSGQFYKAFKMYYDLSCRGLLAEEKIHCLRMSVICAVLAKAGPMRSRALALIYKDERAKTLDCFSILEKMYLRRILRPEEIEAFKAQLSPHHIAKGHDGSTILERAVREHNVQAVAGLYTTIAFAQLGAILNITPEDAEEIVAELISRGSLSGSIDQAAGFASFSSDSALDTWDSSIAAICQDVNAIIAPIAERFPEFIES